MIEHGGRNAVQVRQFDGVVVGQPQPAAQALQRQGVRDGMTDAQPDDADRQPADRVLLGAGDLVAVPVQPQPAERCGPRTDTSVRRHGYHAHRAVRRARPRSAAAAAGQLGTQELASSTTATSSGPESVERLKIRRTAHEHDRGVIAAVETAGSPGVLCIMPSTEGGRGCAGWRESCADSEQAPTESSGSRRATCCGPTTGVWFVIDRPVGHRPYVALAPRHGLPPGHRVAGAVHSGMMHARQIHRVDERAGQRRRQGAVPRRVVSTQTALISMTPSASRCEIWVRICSVPGGRPYPNGMRLVRMVQWALHPEAPDHLTVRLDHREEQRRRSRRLGLAVFDGTFDGVCAVADPRAVDIRRPQRRAEWRAWRR